MALALSSGIVLLGVTSASAHVTVSSPDAQAGGFGKLVFRVPSESESAKTESVTVALPAETPFRFVSTKAMPGWTVQADTEKLDEPVTAEGFEITEAVTEVTWTAEQGNELAPHEFAEFELSVGPFPESVETLTLPTVQRYSDGEVAAWDQPTPENGPEPDNPAPVLDLAAQPGEPVAGDATAAAQDSPDIVARAWAGAGVLLGLLALVATVKQRRRRDV